LPGVVLLEDNPVRITQEAIVKTLSIILAAALFACLPAAAFDLGVTWDAVEGADGYKVYVGTASRTYDLTAGFIVQGEAVSIVGLSDTCDQIYVAVTAYNTWGESAYSTEALAWTRPVLAPSGIKPVGSSTTWTVTGDWFYDGAFQLLINDAPVTSLTWESCKLATFDVATIPGATEWDTIRICNTGESGAICGPVMVPKAPNAPANPGVN
jgi:hypothetical protein